MFAGTNLVFVMIGWIIANMGSGIACAMPFALLGSAVDYGKWKNGVTAAGLLTAIGSSFCLKLGSGIAGFVPTMISGYLNQLTPERFQLVSEGIEVYKDIRTLIPQADPIWPMEMPMIDDEVISFGLKCDKTILLGVWNNIENDHLVKLDLSKYGEIEKVQQIYPKAEELQVNIHIVNDLLQIHFEKAPSARLFKITLK
ncbi:MFS transporter [Peribacillus butanolivorans]|uniref:MFS transporter n=1 Tax=Peribacillus butanolivorans TaxID=421767 RepID=UPI0036D7B52E